MKTQLAKANSIAQIGKEIGIELGKQLVKDYQIANPKDTQYYVIGRNVIDQILAQPGCAGIRFYNAINELGEKTLVYVGVNIQGDAIVKYSCINNEGILIYQNGIVADRAARGGDGESSSAYESDSWNWEID